jgi:hypothetical protein
MRKTIFILTLLSPLFLLAQVEFAPLGAVWYYGWPQLGAPIANKFVKVEVVDTVMIQGKFCKKLVSTDGGCPDTWESEVYIYEENGRVYRLLDSVFQLFMDFNAGPGESWATITIPPDGNDTLIVRVDSVSYVIHNGLQLKVQHVSYPNLSIGFPEGSIMEWGRTFTDRFGNSTFFYPQIGVCDPHAGGIRCYSDDTLDVHFVNYACDTIMLFSDVDDLEDLPRFGLLFPNPANSTVSFSPDFEADEVVFQNLVGTTLLHRTIGHSREIEVGSLNAGVYLVYFYKKNKLAGIDKLLIARQ